MASPDHQQRLAALRDTIADIERKPALAEARIRVEDEGDGFPKLGGGLLQEVFTDEKRNGGASLGFALAQARGLITSQRLAVIYLQLADEAQKLGVPYGPGLLSFGFDPDALVLVRAANMHELLWAAEEAIACRAVAAVVADIGSYSKRLDFTASRRLSLRAAATGGSILLLRYGEGREASAAHLRWRLSPAPSASRRFDAKAPGPLRWRAELERGVLLKKQSEWLLGWTENGLATVSSQPRNTDRLIAHPALPRAVPAHWATDYLKRADPQLKAPLALYETIKGGLRLAALDAEAMRRGLSVGQNLADARAMVPELTVREMDRPLLEAAFADFADWHSNASPLVAVMDAVSGFGDLVLDITGVDHLFGGEKPMLRLLLTRLRALGYTVAGAIAPTIGAAWGVSHFARSQVVEAGDLGPILDALPVAALRLSQTQISGLDQMGLKTIAQLAGRDRKALQARFGVSLLTRLDQAHGHIAERMTPRLPVVERYAERRFADPIGLMDDVLMACHDLAIQLGLRLEAEGMGGQAFHLFLYRVDHKVMALSVNSARLTRDPEHIAKLFSNRSERLAGEYDAGFGIDMIRLAVSSVSELGGVQLGAFTHQGVAEDLDQLNDRMSSRLGALAVLRTQLVASHIPERAARLEPALVRTGAPQNAGWPKPSRPLRLLPVPEHVAINAEVPEGLPASMIWRRESYKIEKASGPERLGAEWWRSGQRLVLVQPAPPKKGEPAPYIPNLDQFDPEAGTRDYYVVEDASGRRFWIFRHGFHQPGEPAVWYLHGFFS